MRLRILRAASCQRIDILFAVMPNQCLIHNIQRGAELREIDSIASADFQMVPSVYFLRSKQHIVILRTKHNEPAPDSQPVLNKNLT